MSIDGNCCRSWRIGRCAKTSGNYPDLIVRVAGYSAVFVNLTKDVQEELLSRTLYD
ncbi:Pyruvate-formate lyase [Faecalitalea cylindroides T2-87]|uniref:Pyruvate-formate lyase n=1 Tax=Faecalitalea cylindroides T2-87 TaxID=717960 RepID=D4JFR6_9FIRM|nr:Pyruvate-formate lyase [Faecalitalea cylindroides T2-87]